MPSQERRARRIFRNRRSGRDDQPDNRLTYLDQAVFLGARATGQELAIQGVWIYEHPVDFDGLKRFHQNFGHGLAGRRIERSPLPFGRHRWVSSLGPPMDIEIAESPRPRAEVGDWADEQAQLPHDPEYGPGWRMGVLPLTDGSTAVSAVGSHCLGDGGAAVLTFFEAVTGNIRDLGYPMPRSKTPLQAMLSDLRETVRAIPETGRTLVAAAKLARRRRTELAKPKTPQSSTDVAGGDLPVVVPAIQIFIDVDVWDARAEDLGGNSYSLMAGLAAKFAEHMGRLRADDGTATLMVPINDRLSLDDTRANAVVLAKVSINPTHVTRDLSEARTALKQALHTAREVPDETLELLPLIPFVPKRAVARLADATFGLSDELPVSCSNMGQLPAEIGRVDGTDAEYVVVRGIDRHVTKRILEERRGLLTLVTARIGPKVSIAVVAYRPGAKNTKAELHELADRTLAEFGLAGVIID